MSNSVLNKLSLQQLKRAVVIRERIDRLEKELSDLIGSTESAPAGKATSRRRKMSAAGRARIAAAARARWAKVKAAKKT